MIRVGSSMTTEAWDESFKPNLTWNHAWGAAPANIIPRKLLGIEPVEPAFTKFRIAPQPASIETVNIRVPTLRGPIDCQMKANRDEWNLIITIPGNTDAELLIPVDLPVVSTKVGLMASKKTISRNMKEYNVFELGSGKHYIKATK